MDSSLLKEKDLCEYLNISRTTLWRYKKNGLPAYKIRNSIRYDLNEVKDWIIKDNETLYLTDSLVENNQLIEEIPKDKILNNYKIDFNYLLQHNHSYLCKYLTITEINELKTILKNFNSNSLDNQAIVRVFSAEYLKIIHTKYQKKNRKTEFDKRFNEIINRNSKTIKIIWGNCYEVLKKIESESIQLMVTSPPYYNAREYSHWENINLYLDEMRLIIRESYRVLDNHRVWVFNVGDIFDNDRLTTKSVWGKKRIPLGAYFIKIFEEEGFEFVDDIIWDKGEVESKRHMNNGINYPFYQYPLNCYEHILIFHKHRLDKTKIPCPVCGSLNVNGNTQSEIGVQSWECKNDKCFVRSPNNRGKRFSLRSNIMQYYHNGNASNLIDKNTINSWRRDIVRFPPVIKINQNGENTLGHTAPFPDYIPEMAIKYFTYAGENVLDPFAGSFTTPIVAKLLERNGVGIELNKIMFRDAIIKKITKKLAFFNNNGSLYEEIES